MNQFIIENPVLCIVIAFIIGAVIMNITSALTVRMAVENEVEKALGEDDGERIGLYPVRSSNVPAPPAPIIHERVLPIWLGKDEDGTTYVYFSNPQLFEAGTGPHCDSIEGAYYVSDDGTYVDIDDLYSDDTNNIKTDLINEVKRMDNLKYGTLKINLYDNDVIKMIHALPGYH